MAVSYTCPNPDCGVTLKTPNRVAAGKSVKCPKCGRPFVPESEDEEEAGAGTFKMVDEEPKKPAPPPAPKSRYDDDDEDEASIKKGYGVVKETEAELAEAEKNKPKFAEVQEKMFKKSARGPAQGLLVMPSNLLVLEGIITAVAGIVFFIVGMWPLVFNDAPPGEEELDEAVATMLLGIVTFAWGAMVCYGASQMQELKSFTWSWVGAVMGIIPLLAGVFAIMMLLNPKVKAGFEEAEAGPDDDDEEEEDDDDDDDEDEDEDEDEDDDDDDDGGSASAKKLAKKAGRKLLKGVLGGGGDEE